MNKIDPNSSEYLCHLSEVVEEDVTGLVKAEQSYGNSWKKRGGVGAFMMLARKWDRLEKQLQNDPQYDIIAHIANDMRTEGIIDDLRDLRRYLILIEAEARALGLESAQSTHRDNTEQINDR